MRTLTFWLRPEFVLRVVNRFQKVAGFDRSIALASGALTALIPLSILASSLSSQLGGKDTAERIIERYDLTGGGAEAVEDIFSPASGTETSLGIIGFLFLMVAVLSFSRGVQRLIEQTWELDPLSVRNTFNGLLWIGGLTAVRRSQRRPPGHAGANPARPHRDADRPSAVGGLPGLERLGAQRQADQAPGPPAVRHRRSGPARRVLGWRGGVRPAPLQHVLNPLRRDRRGIRDDLGALLRHGRSGRLGGRRP